MSETITPFPSRYSSDNFEEPTITPVFEVIYPSDSLKSTAVTRGGNTGEKYTFVSGSHEAYLKINDYTHVCKKVVRALWRNHKYNALYISFVTGQLSKAEFKSESKRFTVDPDSFSPEEAARQIAIVVSLIGHEEELGSGDLAFLLDGDLNVIESTLTQYHALPAARG